MTPEPGLVYVVEYFPAYSQTFIQNELRALRSMGAEPEVVSLYPLHDAADPTAAGLRHRLLPSPSGRPVDLLVAAIRVATRHPIGLIRAVLLAAARPSRLQFHALAKAVFLAGSLRGRRVERIHAHFARASASVAMLAALMVGARFSFTGHAIDIFWQPFDVDRKLERADVTVTVCDYNRAFIEAEWPGLGEIVVIPCGVDPVEFARTTAYRTSPFTVVAVGRLVEKKGFHDLVAACAILRDRGADLVCRIIGDGDRHDELEAQIRDLAVEDSVHLVGRLTPAEVRAELEGATVLCMPCVVEPNGNRDSQPVVVKEAMAMEVPVIVTREVGLPEMVDEEVGLVVPPKDPVALADALMELRGRDSKELAAMGVRARQRVIERYSIGAGAAALLKAFRRAEQS